MNSKSKIISSVRLFRTSVHSCSYKDGEDAATVFVDPELVIDQSLNSKLSELGFRRSGAHLYRPDCDSCAACISCRVPVAGFNWSRRQRKIWKSNQDLNVEYSNALDDSDSYALYKRYINTRHRDGDMYPATPEQFEAFIKTGTDDTLFYKFYHGDKLLAVSVMDVLQQGLSAVYTFFDPDYSKRSLGNFVILWQIRKAKEMELAYLFLGYWIKGCAKMQYKSSFRPIEMLIEGNWILLN